MQKTISSAKMLQVINNAQQQVTDCMYEEDATGSVYFCTTALILSDLLAYFYSNENCYKAQHSLKHVASIVAQHITYYDEQCLFYAIFANIKNINILDYTYLNN